MEGTKIDAAVFRLSGRVDALVVSGEDARLYKVRAEGGDSAAVVERSERMAALTYWRGLFPHVERMESVKIGDSYRYFLMDGGDAGLEIHVEEMEREAS